MNTFRKLLSVFLLVLAFTLILPTHINAAKRWGTRTDGDVPIEAITFVGARRGQPEASADLDPSLDCTNGFETYAPEEVPNLVRKYKDMGINQISISTWRRYGDKQTNGNGFGETIPTDQAYTDMVREVEKQNLKFMPFIEFWQEGSEGNLPLGAVLDPSKYDLVARFLASYVNQFGDSRAWARYYNQNGQIRLGFKFIEAVKFNDNQSSQDYFRGLEEIASRVYNLTGKRIGFWLDNSMLPIDHPEWSEINAVDMTNSISYPSILGSSIFNPNHIEGYVENMNSYRSPERVINNLGVQSMYNDTSANIDRLISAGIPYQLPVEFSYDSRHLGWSETSRYKLGSNQNFYDNFVAPLIRKYASRSVGYSLGLGNNTSEWQFVLPTATDSTIHEFAKKSIRLYKRRAGI